MFGAGFVAACCLMVLGVTFTSCAPVNDEPPPDVEEPTGDQPEGDDATKPRKTSFYIEQDEEGAADFDTVVQPGQLVYFRSKSGNDIQLGFDAGKFVGAVSPIILPKDGTPVELQVDPGLGHLDSIGTWVIGDTNGHGSPTLIVRTKPIGTDEL
jgi:hypothetical protein